MVQKYQNEIATIFYYGFSTKAHEKDLKIPILHPPDWKSPYWMTLYVRSNFFLQCPLVARRLQDLAAAMRGVRGAGDLHVRLGVPQNGGPGEDQSEHGIWSRDRSAHLLLASTWACAWTASCSGAAACTTPRTTSSRTRATPPARWAAEVILWFL